MSEAKLQPFSDHIKELRQRLIYVVVVVVVGSVVGYVIHEPLFNFLKKPLGQQLYYNTPIGSFGAMMKVSMLVGLVSATPLLLHQICQFLSPAFKSRSKYFHIKILLFSMLLAITGMSFGYFVSLPASLKFLTNFDSQNIQPLILVGEYLNFVFSYLLGFAVLFQIPIAIILINNIKQINIRKFFGYQRWVILISFVLAAILTPTPDPLNQALMAIPVIVLYQISLAVVWIKNRRLAKCQK